MKNKIIITGLLLMICACANSQGKAFVKADSLYFGKAYKEAAMAYKTALPDSSTNAILWQRLAYAQYMSGDLNNALKNYKKSLDNKPNPVLSGIVYTNMFNIFEAQNKPGDAILFLKQAADKGFNNLQLIDTLQVFAAYKNENVFKEAREKVIANAYPCLSMPHGKDFDFWIGEWDVYITGTSTLIGRSSITKVNGGCVVMENWTSLVSPQTGISLNFIDPVSRNWMQDYSGSGGSRQLYIGGEYKDTAMRFVYEGVYNNASYPGHFIFYNEGPDRVRQFQDYSSDGGKTFTTGYDYTYIRRK